MDFLLPYHGFYFSFLVLILFVEKFLYNKFAYVFKGPLILA